MMPITRPELEILLDTPDRRDYVVMRLRRPAGARWLSQLCRRSCPEPGSRCSRSRFRKPRPARRSTPISCAIERAIANADSSARGLAVFSGADRKLFHVVTLHFPVENELVIDEDPFVLPLLERWYGDPNYLVAVIDTHHLHLFEAHSGVAEEVKEIDRDIPEMQRDKPRFTYKKRFAKTFDERLHSLDDDAFLKTIAESIAEHWHIGAFGPDPARDPPPTPRPCADRRIRKSIHTLSRNIPKR